MDTPNMRLIVSCRCEQAADRIPIGMGQEITGIQPREDGTVDVIVDLGDEVAPNTTQTVALLENEHVIFWRVLPAHKVNELHFLPVWRGFNPWPEVQ